MPNSTRHLPGWWHLYDFTPGYRYVGRRSHVVILGPWGEKSLCGRIWNLNRRSGDGYRQCAECLRRQETLPPAADAPHKRIADPSDSRPMHVPDDLEETRD